MTVGGLKMLWAIAFALGTGNLIQNPDFEMHDDRKVPTGYELSGSARWEYGGYQDEVATYGVSLDSFASEGSVSQMVRVDPARGKWITFRFRGRPEEAFAVKGDQLFIKLDFYGKGG